LGQHAMAGRLLRESNEAARRTDAWDVLFRNAWYLRALAARTADEFTRRTCERTLRQLLGRTDPFAEEALEYRREVAVKDQRRQESAGGNRTETAPDGVRENGSEHGSARGPSLPCPEPARAPVDPESCGAPAPSPEPPPRYRPLGAPAGRPA